MEPRKTQQADLEQRRPLFFTIGLVTTLSVVTGFFEMEFQVRRMELKAKEIIWEEEDLIVVMPEVQELHAAPPARQKQPAVPPRTARVYSQEFEISEVPEITRRAEQKLMVQNKLADPSLPAAELSGAADDQGTDPETAEAGTPFLYMKVMKEKEWEHTPIDNTKEKHLSISKGYETAKEVVYKKMKGVRISTALSRNIIELVQNKRVCQVNDTTAVIWVHENYAVNVHQVDSVKQNTLVLKDGTEIPVGDDYRKSLHRQIRHFAGGSLGAYFAHADTKKAKYTSSHENAASFRTNPFETMNVTAYNASISASFSFLDVSFHREIENQRFNKILLPREIIKSDRPLDWNIDRSYGMADRTIKIDHTMAAFSNLAQALSGRVAGVTVDGNDIYIRSSVMKFYTCQIHPEINEQNPGTCPICSRTLVFVKKTGMSSSNDGSPLFLLDGMPVSKETILSISMSSIAAVDILKGPSSTTFFGVRGANGVIAVYTRRDLVSEVVE